MIQIRRKTFETNSSSTHSFTVCNDETWEKFLNGELYFNIKSHEVDEEEWKEHKVAYSLPAFITKEEYKKYLPDLLKEEGYNESDKYNCAKDFLNEAIFKVDYADNVSRNDNGEVDIEYFYG